MQGAENDVATRQVRSMRIGLALAIFAAATFGTSGIFGSSLIDAGWSPAAAVLARISIAAVVLTVPALLQLRGRWAVLRASARPAVAYGLIAVAGCQLFFFNAISHMQVGVALLIEYLGPILVVGWLWLRHGQRPRRLTVTGAIAAMAGLALVLDVFGSARINPVGTMWALLAAAGLATFFVLSAAHGEQLPPVVMAWAGLCVGAVTLGTLGLTGLVPIRAMAVRVQLAGHQVSWVVPVLGLSVIAAAIAYLAGIGAARRLGAKLASFVSMAEVLFAIVFAWLLLGQLPGLPQFAGGALILAGVTLVRLDELRAGPPAGLVVSSP
ncbi:MAG TPA: DMT family transporter [Streptosporangiaceae bacterium]|nr:DMT family transporter [Streptosporangiaceae bacterium]